MGSDLDRPLRICLLSYRSNPHSGGQGVYIKYLSKALKDLGHHVEVAAGPPGPHLDDGVALHSIPCLDLYNPEDPFRTPRIGELYDPINYIEWIGTTTMGFPEPYTFGLRALKYIKTRRRDFDVIHDNQCLSHGIWRMNRYAPTTITIHHPITVDRRIALQSVRSPWKKLKNMRWYSFVGMQKRVARKFSNIITVSEFAADDIAREFGVDRRKFRVAPNGIDVEHFRPLEGVQRRPRRLIVTNSADTPLKGLYYLLHAVHRVAQSAPVELTVVGKPKEKGVVERLVRELDLGRIVTFTGRIDDDEFLRQYAMASVAVAPSLYEGFGLPAGEAMACGLPVISTTGGALPEVVGDAGVLVPPADAEALAAAIVDLLDNPAKAAQLGRKGFERVHGQFTWRVAAQKTVDAYKETIREHRGFQPGQTSAR